MPSVPFVVGAYASLPPEKADQEAYYALLGGQDWIAGTELPYPGDLADAESRAWLAAHVPAHWHGNTITAIPGTMRSIGADPTFGLASADEGGRQSALRFLAALRDALADFNDCRGSWDVSHVEIHTAPTRTADRDAMAASLEELLRWDWCGAKLVIEHCDRYIEGQSPEKGFLPIEDEIALARDAGIGITVNWGRSVVEGRDPSVALDHIRAAAQAGVLAGVMFSGAGPAETQYGYGWIDGHLPMNPDEPTSLMDAAAVRTCADAAREASELAYLGTKVCVPASSALAERLDFLEHIHQAATA